MKTHFWYLFDLLCLDKFWDSFWNVYKGNLEDFLDILTLGLNGSQRTSHMFSLCIVIFFVVLFSFLLACFICTVYVILKKKS